ncbi:MAG: transposase [Acidobacteria bacterium]|nr:transposase [Acidobacteriota bacterium]
MALWAELDVVVADQFRAGNTPAIQEPLAVAQRAFEALPETVTERYFRGDSACYETELLDWLRDENRQTGHKGCIGFAVSAPMRKPLKSEIAALDDSAWLRYLALRAQKQQGELFADGSDANHYAVATNLWNWAPRRLLAWHREKAGSIEALHDVLKNELAAEVLPCGRFGANAAWLRLSALTHNVLTTMKRLALPPELLQARPKRLRFLVFAQPGKFVRHARRLTLRLMRAWRRFSNWAWAFEQLPLAAPS